MTPDVSSPVTSPKVGCIGAGYWGRNLIRNFDDLGALAWICDARRQTLEEIAQKYPRARPTHRVEDLFADDATRGIVIATPAETHAGLVRRALVVTQIREFVHGVS